MIETPAESDPSNNRRSKNCRVSEGRRVTEAGTNMLAAMLLVGAANSQRENTQGERSRREFSDLYFFSAPGVNEA